MHGVDRHSFGSLLTGTIFTMQKEEQVTAGASHPGSSVAQKKDHAVPGLEPYTGPWGNSEIIHLLKRTMFGAKKEDVNYFKNKTLAATIDELLNPADLPASFPLNDYDMTGVVPYGTSWVNAPFDLEDTPRQILSVQKWMIGTFITQGRSVREKMQLFWHNHFATQITSSYSQLVWLHHSLLRKEALGNFKELTRSITTDCHMLQYLNGQENTRLAPNENYARELQELFCIGKGVHAHFTEDDVKQAAKILTGWKVDPFKRISYFEEKEHDNSDKYFSSFYNNTIIKGREGPASGGLELDDLLNMIFSNKETALFICRKLYRWFVYYAIDDSTEEKIIEPLSVLLRQHNYNVKPVLETLFKSKHFFDPVNHGVQIKSPIDLCIGMQREFNVAFRPASQLVSNYDMWGLILEFCSKMGQEYCNPPSVSGWPAYYQAPGFYQQWINTTTYTKRNEFSILMINYGLNTIAGSFATDLVSFARSLADPANPDALINESLALLYRVPILEESKKDLKKNTLLSGQMQDHYWTDAWNEYISNPGNAELKNVVETRLKSLYHYIVSSPEYQLA